jgi:3-oxoacyl-[acyl-carrier protein] reductase
MQQRSLRAIASLALTAFAIGNVRAEVSEVRISRVVTTIACDITTPEGRKAALALCPQPDILINNAGGPPPGDFREWDRDVWIKALDADLR